MPAEALRETGGRLRGGGHGGLGGPVVVLRVAGRRRRSGRVERVLRREGSAELAAESGNLSEVRRCGRGVDEVALPLSPLRPAVLEPNLKDWGEFAHVMMSVFSLLAGDYECVILCTIF